MNQVTLVRSNFYHYQNIYLNEASVSKIKWSSQTVLNALVWDLQLKQNTVEANVIWSNTYMPPTFELLRISERSRRLKEDAKKTPDMFPSYFLRWVEFLYKLLFLSFLSTSLE